MSAIPEALLEASYASLTTFRRSGEGVATPVWIAPALDGSGRLMVITNDDTGKTKRLAHTARVELQPCDIRGRVADGAPVFTGAATVVRDEPGVRAVRQAVGAKYGIQAKIAPLWMSIASKLGLTVASRAGIVITLDEPGNDSGGA